MSIVCGVPVRDPSAVHRRPERHPDRIPVEPRARRRRLWGACDRRVPGMPASCCTTRRWPHAGVDDVVFADGVRRVIRRASRRRPARARRTSAPCTRSPLFSDARAAPTRAMLMMSVAAATLAALAPTADAVAMVTALSKCEMARLNRLGGRQARRPSRSALRRSLRRAACMRSRRRRATRATLRLVAGASAEHHLRAGRGHRRPTARARDRFSKTSWLVSFRSLKLCNDSSRMPTLVWSVNTSSPSTPTRARSSRMRTGIRRSRR